jgi:hypothetical protein
MVIKWFCMISVFFTLACGVKTGPAPYYSIPESVIQESPTMIPSPTVTPTPSASPTPGTKKKSKK